MPVLRMRRQLHFERIDVVAELFGVTMGRLDRLVVGHVPSAFMHVNGMGVTNMSGRGIVEGHDLRGDDPWLSRRTQTVCRSSESVSRHAVHECLLGSVIHEYLGSGERRSTAVARLTAGGGHALDPFNPLRA